MKTATITHHHDQCPSCKRNKVIIDEKIGESHCTHCGLVISENTVSMGAEWRSFEGGIDKARTGDQTSLMLHDMGLSTVIAKTNKDGSGKPISNGMANSFIRLRRQNSRIQSKDAFGKNFIVAFSDMNNLRTKLALPDPIMETAAYRYRKAVEKGLTRGRTIKAMVGACVYFACRESEISRSLHDIAKTINMPRRDVTKAYRTLLKEFEITVPPPNPINYVSKIANKVGLSEKTMRRTREVLEKERKVGGFSGRDPYAIAAAVLYIVSRKNRESISQREISEATGVTEVTIRNRIRGLNESVLKECKLIREPRKRRKPRARQIEEIKMEFLK